MTEKNDISGITSQFGGYETNKPEENNTVNNNHSRDEIIKKRKEQFAQKKERIIKIRSFLTLKVKVHQLINLKRFDQAKESYHSLYKIYQELVSSGKQGSPELAKFHKDLTSIYELLNKEINIKRVKKGSISNSSDKNLKNNEQDNNKKKVVTTDLDVIIKTVEEKGKMNISEIQTAFNISKRIAEEWIQTLADFGLVDIKYLPVGGIEIRKIKTKS